MMLDSFRRAHDGSKVFGIRHGVRGDEAARRPNTAPFSPDPLGRGHSVAPPWRWVGLNWWTKMFAPEISQIPAELVGGVANLPDLMVAFARLKGIQRPDADRIVSLVPTELNSALCFLDRLTAIWRYIYGRPFTGLPDGKIVLGTHMYHEVDRLFDIISCAQTLLTSQSLSAYLKAISDRAKHEDALVEFAPILRLDLDSCPVVEYETPGAGDNTIDWLIRIPERIDLLLEVKNRAGDLFEGLCRSQSELAGRRRRIARTSPRRQSPVQEHRKEVSRSQDLRGSTSSLDQDGPQARRGRVAFRVQEARPRSSPHSDSW